MIKNAVVKSEIVDLWRAVRRLSAEPGSSIIPGAGIVQHPVATGFCNLPLVLAYAVLEQVLEVLAEERRFLMPKKPKLANLMMNSKAAISWLDFDYIDKGRERRNELAHDAELVPDAECLGYIDAVETQLRSWKVIPDAA